MPNVRTPTPALESVAAAPGAAGRSPRGAPHVSSAVSPQVRHEFVHRHRVAARTALSLSPPLQRGGVQPHRAGVQPQAGTESRERRTAPGSARLASRPSQFSASTRRPRRQRSPTVSFHTASALVRRLPHPRQRPNGPSRRSVEIGLRHTSWLCRRLTGHVKPLPSREHWSASRNAGRKGL